MKSVLNFKSFRKLRNINIRRNHNFKLSFCSTATKTRYVHNRTTRPDLHQEKQNAKWSISTVTHKKMTNLPGNSMVFVCVTLINLWPLLTRNYFKIGVSFKEVRSYQSQRMQCWGLGVKLRALHTWVLPLSYCSNLSRNTIISIFYYNSEYNCAPAL